MYDNNLSEFKSTLSHPCVRVSLCFQWCFMDSTTWKVAAKRPKHSCFMYETLTTINSCNGKHVEVFVLSIVVGTDKYPVNKHRRSIAKGEVAVQRQHNYPINQPIKDSTRCPLSLCNWIITGQRAQAQSRQKAFSKCQKTIEINYTSLKSLQWVGWP